jgi:hypothetical protein
MAVKRANLDRAATEEVKGRGLPVTRASKRTYQFRLNEQFAETVRIEAERKGLTLSSAVRMAMSDLAEKWGLK